jgi:hypothetical protein
MASLRVSLPDNSFKLCPAFSAPKKAGRPKTNKRLKNVMEVVIEKKKAAAKKIMSKKTVGRKRKETPTKQGTYDGTKRTSRWKKAT